MALKSYKSKPEGEKVTSSAQQGQQPSEENNQTPAEEEGTFNEKGEKTGEVPDQQAAQKEADEGAAEQTAQSQPPAEETKTEEGDPQMVSVGVVKELMIKIDQLEKRQQDNFQLIIDKKKPGEAYTPGELPVEDYLDEPVIFFAFASYFAIYGDKRMNKMISTPYGTKIGFKKAFRWTKRSKTGRGTDVVTISQAVVRSKREVEWLRSHSKYQITFFESMKKAQDTDPSYAQELADASGVVSGMGDMQVIERAKLEKLDVIEDMDALRKEVTKVIADKNIKVKRTNRDKEVQRMHNTETVDNVAARAEEQHA